MTAILEWAFFFYLLLLFYSPILDISVKKKFSFSFLFFSHFLLASFLSFYFGAFVSMSDERERRIKDRLVQGGVRSASFMSHHCLFDHCHMAKVRAKDALLKGGKKEKPVHLAIGCWPTSISRIEIDLSFQPGGISSHSHTWRARWMVVLLASQTIAQKGNNNNNNTDRTYWQVWWVGDGHER